MEMAGLAGGGIALAPGRRETALVPKCNRIGVRGVDTRSTRADRQLAGGDRQRESIGPRPQLDQIASRAVGIAIAPRHA